MGSISADKLTWNSKKVLSETGLTETTINFDLSGEPDSDYLLVMRNTNTESYSGSVQAGDFWMDGQGTVDFNVTSSQATDHVIGPFESGRVMQSDSTIQVEMNTNTTLGNMVVSLVETPKP